MVSKPGLLMLAWQAPHLSGRERAVCGRDRGAAHVWQGQRGSPGTNGGISKVNCRSRTPRRLIGEWSAGAKPWTPEACGVLRRSGSAGTPDGCHFVLRWDLI